jgi:hypothetical protein
LHGITNEEIWVFDALNARVWKVCEILMKDVEKFQ